MGTSKVGALIALAAAIVVVGGSYLYVQGQLSEAVDSLTVEYSGLEVTGLSLLPFEVNLTLKYEVRNPSGMDFSVSVDGSLLFGDRSEERRVGKECRSRWS